jgi:LPXTG-motif cell wall-anchored protein
VTESVPGLGPGTDTLEDGGSPSAGLRPVSAVLGVSAESLPLTGLGVTLLFLTGLMLLSSGAVLRRRSVAAG